MAAQSESERQLLDVGCGPGSITLDLAGLVAPGQVVGIDIQRAQIDQARALASARGVTTVRFEWKTSTNFLSRTPPSTPPSPMVC